MSKFFGTLQKVGQSLMMPVSALPAAGLLVALGRLLQKSTETADGQVVNKFWHVCAEIFFSGGLAIFQQLPVIFAVGVAIGFTGGAGVAGLAAVVGYFTLANVLKVFNEAWALKLAIDTGVFGGILIGLATAAIYRRFHETKLPSVIGFFSGKRLVPIVTGFSALAMGVVLAFVWPPVQLKINEFGTFVMNSDLGPAFYAAGKRLLIPLGLHHVYYPPFLFQFGEFVTSAGKVLHGETARYFGGDPTAGRFMASEFPIMLFGLPAAAFAMYLRADSSRKKAVGGVMLAAALTSIITGITEPIEFAFIFVAPVLYVFHVLAAFSSGLLTAWFDIHLGYTFSASLIDYGLGFFNQKNGWMLFAIVGPLIAILYFGVFYTAIGWLQLKTPGRETEETVATGPLKISDKAVEVLSALGGAKNILHIDACITRLRLSLQNGKAVNTSRLKELGAAGILDAGGGQFQVNFGTESDILKEQIKKLMVTTLPATGTQFVSPLKGRVMDLAEVPDATFAGKILGEGCAIVPTEGTAFAPFDGEVVQVFRTKHAIGLKNKDGVEALIHVGIDTVKMNGEGFTSYVKEGDQVVAGQKLLGFDLKIIEAHGKSLITPVIITNPNGHRIELSARPGYFIESNQELFKVEATQ